MRSFPGGSDSKESACNAGDQGSIPGSGRSLGEENGNPLQYSCLKNPMDRRTWQVTVHTVTNSQTWLRGSTHAGTPRVYVNPKLVTYPSPAVFVLLQWSGTKSIISGFCPHPLPAMAASSRSSPFPSSLPASSSLWLKRKAEVSQMKCHSRR